MNQYLEGNAAGIRFAAAIEDTRLEPARALEQAKALHARGVRLLIGPQSSAEVEHLKPFVDGQAMLLVSPSSTAARLALKDDNVFRFTLTDELEGVAIAMLMWADGIRVMVPIWRDDAGNAGLEAATRKAFTDLGGIVLPGVKYGTVAQDFGATVGAVAAQLNQAIGEHGVTQTAVYLAAFDEVVELFASAKQDATARSVRWYGSNGVARSDVLIGNPQAVEFAIHTGMSEWMVFSGGILTYGMIGWWGIAIAVIALLNALLSLGYYLPIIKTLYLPSDHKKVAKAKDASPVMLVAIVLLAALTILLGIWPELGLQAVKPAVDILMMCLGGV